MLRMIAELVEDNEDCKLNQQNLYKIYEEFTTKMMLKCMDKGPDAKMNFANQAGTTQVQDFYTKCAFHSIDYYNVIWSVEVTNSLFHETKTPSTDDIIRVGLVFSDDERNFFFVHKTFAEFLIAKLIFEYFFCQKQAKFQYGSEIFLKTLISLKFELRMVRIFLDSALESFDIKNLKKASELKPMLFKALNNGPTWPYSSGIRLVDFFNDRCFNLITYITSHLVDDCQSFLEKNQGDHVNFLKIMMSTSFAKS
jgi:hypothetical protein